MLKALGESYSLYSTFEAININNKIPFVDSEDYLNRICENGMFCYHTNTIKLNTEPYYDNMILHVENDIFDNPSDPGYIHLATIIAFAIQYKLGVINDFDASNSSMACLHLRNTI